MLWWYACWWRLASATSAPVVYVFGTSDLLGHKVGQVMDACAVYMANYLMVTNGVKAEWLQSWLTKDWLQMYKTMINFNDTIIKWLKSMYTSFCES